MARTRSIAIVFFMVITLFFVCNILVREGAPVITIIPLFTGYSRKIFQKRIRPFVEIKGGGIVYIDEKRANIPPGGFRSRDKGTIL
jgi:hypothetical protein